MKVTELYPVPDNLNPYAALALSNVSIDDDPNAFGFSRIPILANWLPVMKSGFSASFSILA